MHPLIDHSAKHYINKDGKATIYMIEKELTPIEMIGACKFNIFKYNSRDKGQDESDEKKSRNNKRYLDFLLSLVSKCGDDAYSATCRELIDKEFPNIRY